MKIYISGPMTGIEDLNRAAFKKTQDILEAMGHEAFNPGDHSLETRRLCLETDLVWICRKAEGIVMLWDWPKSSGANAELATALAIGIPVWYQVATERGKFMSYDRTTRKNGAMYLGAAA